MHKNKYQKKRGLRPSTSAASATQQELFQGPIQQPSGSQLSNDLGRETARQLRENANPNTRFIDKPNQRKIRAFYVKLQNVNNQ